MVSWNGACGVLRLRRPREGPCGATLPGRALLDGTGRRPGYEVPLQDRNPITIGTLTTSDAAITWFQYTLIGVA